MTDKLIGPFRVLEVNQKSGSFFSACLPAKDLTSITYSDVRRLVSEDRDVERYLGVQRPLSRDRVRKIRDYILSPDPTFPTAIIIAVDEECVGYDLDRGEMTLFEAHVQKDTGDGKEIPIEKIAKVLDGQHRLAGFFDENGEFDIGGSDFDLNVAIFVGADLSVQAQIFATVNLAQTKVSKSLVYELEDLSEIRSPFKTCHNIAVALDKLSSSPFYKRIKRLGFVTPGRTGETITQAAFVEALTGLISRDPFADRNLLLDGKNRSRLQKMTCDGCRLEICFLKVRISILRITWTTILQRSVIGGQTLGRIRRVKAESYRRPTLFERLCAICEMFILTLQLTLTLSYRYSVLPKRLRRFR